jgi:hypothetical protein
MEDAKVANRELAAAGFGVAGDAVSIMSPPRPLSLLPGLVLLRSPVKDMVAPELTFIKSSTPIYVGARVVALDAASSTETGIASRSGD